MNVKGSFKKIVNGIRKWSISENLKDVENLKKNYKFIKHNGYLYYIKPVHYDGWHSSFDLFRIK